MSRQALLCALGLAAAIIYPLLAPNYLINIGMMVFFVAFIGQSWNIAGSFAGQTGNFSREVTPRRRLVKDHPRDRHHDDQQWREREDRVIGKSSAEPHRAIVHPIGSGGFQQAWNLTRMHGSRIGAPRTG